MNENLECVFDVLIRRTDGYAEYLVIFDDPSAPKGQKPLTRNAQHDKKIVRLSSIDILRFPCHLENAHSFDHYWSVIMEEKWKKMELFLFRKTL